jgi:ornithine carbamoyltransferase
MKRDLLSFALWGGDDLKQILGLTARLKSQPDGSFRPLGGRGVCLVFERESLRTRVSFEIGIAQLGGHPVFLQQETIGIATRESVHDIGLVLSEYAALIVARTTRHQTCAQLAESSTVPLINAMTDLLHPCQILADVFTLQEVDLLSPKSRIVFVGHGNNIANSWLELAEKLPLHLVLCCPEGYEPHAQILEQSMASGLSTVELVTDPVAAVRGADAVYTDVWASMGQEKEREERARIFAGYRVDAALMSLASARAIFLHCLPAHRGDEVTDEVIDGSQSRVWDEAENRWYTEQALIYQLVTGEEKLA